MTLRIRLSVVLAGSAAALGSACSTAPTAAPAPAPVPVQSPATDAPGPAVALPVSPAFERAIARRTRTRTGEPGPLYWQQWARYTLQATLDPRAKRLTGSGQVRYFNRSPDTLATVAIHLYQNLFRPGAARNDVVPETRGMILTRLAAQGVALRSTPARETGPGYAVDGTVATLRLPRPLLPGDSADIEAAWSFDVPPDGAPRMGQDGEIYYLAYWYPQIAVYDDVGGWHTDQYLGNAEFYMGFGDYDVSITAPAGWLVAATGALQNERDVLSTRSRERLARARVSREPVRIVAAEERGAGKATTGAPDGTLTWRFSARNVRDFAFGASDKYLWDAALAVVGDRDGDGRADTSLVQSFWRPERGAWAWDKSARYAQHSVEFLSRYLWPYPYPHMTVVDGLVSCSGMEYPMMTCIGGRRDTLSLYSVTVHEIAHMWFPMQVASDEKRFAWQDEGVTRFNQAQAMREFFNGYDLEGNVRNVYLNLARSGGEVELMRHGDLYPSGPAYAVASYQKMATNLVALRALLGDSLFMRAYHEYARRWLNRHPQPQDFFNSFEHVSGRDLSWFWRTWWYETAMLDQAVGAVTREGDAYVVRIENRGRAPMPVRMVVRRSGGGVDRVELPVEAWLSGATSAEVRVPAAAAVVEVAIDPEERFPDADRSNNVWRP